MWYRTTDRGSKPSRKGLLGRARGRGRDRRSPLLWDECEPRMLLSEEGPVASLSINDVQILRTATGTVDADFTVTLSNPSIENIVSVDYATADGTAHQNIDYTPQSGTLMFDPDEPS